MNEKEVKSWMIRNAELDDCGEVNCTQLGESAAQQFNLYEGDDIPEEVFELAFEAAQVVEAN